MCVCVCVRLCYLFRSGERGNPIIDLPFRLVCTHTHTHTHARTHTYTDANKHKRGYVGAALTCGVLLILSTLHRIRTVHISTCQVRLLHTLTYDPDKYDGRTVWVKTGHVRVSTAFRVPIDFSLYYSKPLNVHIIAFKCYFGMAIGAKIRQRGV